MTDPTVLSLAQEIRAGLVKPLQWVQFPNGGWWGNLPEGVGLPAYEVINARWRQAISGMWVFCDNDEAAKAGAQSDYNERILSALNLDALSDALAEVERLREVLGTTREIVTEAALTGFRWQDGNWTQRLYENQGTISRALDATSASLLSEHLS